MKIYNVSWIMSRTRLLHRSQELKNKGLKIATIWFLYCFNVAGVTPRSQFLLYEKENPEYSSFQETPSSHCGVSRWKRAPGDSLNHRCRWLPVSAHDERLKSPLLRRIKVHFKVLKKRLLSQCFHIGDTQNELQCGSSNFWPHANLYLCLFLFMSAVSPH